METIAIGIQNILAPCGCACKYCLLQSCKSADDGVEYDRGKRLAVRFAEWGREKNRTNLPFYYISYCAEYPELFDNIAYNQSVGFVGARFLQCNGIRIRDKAETDVFCAKLAAAGVRMIDTTFYGDEGYHDRFAAREGDYRFMLRLAASAKAAGITCAPSVMVTEENRGMLDALFDTLEGVVGLEDVHSFPPDYRGRGDRVEDVRLTRAGYEALPERVKKTLNIARYRTQAEWLKGGSLPEYTRRAVTITLRKDNIDRFERMTCDELVAYVEALDDAYYRAIPTVNGLAGMYGDQASDRLYRVRDLFWMWQRRYIREHALQLYDVTDEQLCHTVRS